MNHKWYTIFQNLLLIDDIDGQKVAYFRGRKLHGKAVRVPEGYRGLIVEKQEATKPQAPRNDEPEVIDVEAEDDVPLGTLKTRAEFDEMLVWGHESIAEASSDPYVRGVDEWIKLAEQVRVEERLCTLRVEILMQLADAFI